MKTGIIKAIYDDGDFTTDYGHLFAYKMVIQFQGEQSQTEGGINSKSHPYPMGQGDEITVEIKNTQHGVKFKKVNPQYAQGAPQGGSQSYRQPAQGQKLAPRDYDAENRGKCRTQFIKAAIINGGLRCTCYEHVLELTEFAMTGITPQEAQSQPQDDTIPF